MPFVCCSVIIQLLQQFVEANMAHEERSNMLNNKDAKFDNLNEEQKSTV